MSVELSNWVTGNQSNTRKECGPRNHLMYLLAYRKENPGPEKVTDLPKNTQQVRDHDRLECLQLILVQMSYHERRADLSG